MIMEKKWNPPNLLRKPLHIFCVSVIVFYVGCKKELPESIYGDIDVTHQKLELQFDWEEKQVHGRTEIAMKLNRDLDTVLLDAKELAIKEITLQGAKDLGFLLHPERDGDELEIVLDRTYQIGEELTLTITYQTHWKNKSDPNNIWGSFGKGIRFFGPTETEKERRKQAWTFGEPNSSKYWFPCHDNPKDVRTTEFIATVESPLMVISNGTLKQPKDNDNGTKTFHWVSDIPYANHLTSFTVGEYSNYEQNFEDVKINNYGYPDEVVGTKASVISLPDIMKFYSEYTAKKYPYPEYSQIFVQDFGGWKGNMMSSTITENMVDDKTTHEDFYFLWDVVEGEALAFQWFGNYTKPAGWKDIWLSKAFCRHLSGLYSQFANGNEEYQIYQHNPDMNLYLSDWNSAKPTIVVPERIDDVEAFVNGNTPKAKGSLVLNMLRTEMGEAKWKKLIQTYISDFGNKPVSTQDFAQLVNTIQGSSMDWFFEQWVYGVGHPKFKVTEAYDSETKMFQLTVQQIQQVDSIISGKRIPFFQGKMSMEIDGKILETYIEPKKENRLEFSSESEPSLVNFDYQDVWIKESEFKKTNEELVHELSATEDIIHRINTMFQLTGIATDSIADTATINKITSSLFAIAESETHWRNKLFAIWQLQSIFTTNSEDGIARLTPEQETKLLRIIDKNKSWVKASAINFLGDTRKKAHVELYLQGLMDYSDRVTFMAAIAFGKSKDVRAFDALMELPKKPSWKNQSLISAMYGLKELGDSRALEFTLKTLTDSDNPHWNLGTPIWDHRLSAAHTLVALGKSDLGYPLILEDFKDAMNEGHINDIFYNALQVSILADERGQEVFDALKEKFKGDENTEKAIENLEKQFKSNLK